ncbi:hypothetical protein [Streptomyces zhihengii]
MTAQGEDILAFLEHAISQAEAGAARWHDLECDVHAASLIDVSVLHHATLCDCAGPSSVLRRCAADRKLLQLHGGNMHSCPATDETGYLDEWTQFSHEDPCPVVELLAANYGWGATQASASAPTQTAPSTGDEMT